MDNDASPLADTEVHYLRSESVGDEFKVFVGHCGTGTADAASTLYLTDANGFFGSAVDVIRLMQLASHLPPMLVIGIGYRAGALHETFWQRTRDLTPSADRGFAEFFPDFSEMAGAEATLGFVRDELMPWVGSRYPSRPDDTTFFGHSLGGLFGTYVLLTAPETFRRYAIGSPSLWWDDGVISSYEDAYAREHGDLPARVFFGIGGNETYEGRRREAARYPDELRQKATAWPFDMVDDMLRLVERLEQRSYASLDVTSRVFADEFHVTVAQLILSRALRSLYDAPR